MNACTCVYVFVGVPCGFYLFQLAEAATVLPSVIITPHHHHHTDFGTPPQTKRCYSYLTRLSHFAAFLLHFSPRVLYTNHLRPLNYLT
jgi:hypothetical protein